MAIDGGEQPESTGDKTGSSLFSIEVLTNNETHGSIVYVVKNTNAGVAQW